MPQVCWYFHIHQPWRIRPYSVFDAGNASDYFDIDNEYDFSNQRVIEKVAEKSYRPMLRLLLHLLHKHPDFRFSLSITGVIIEQFQQFAPDIMELLQAIVATGRVEILAETYHHSLASLFDEGEFFWQVEQHTRLIHELFGVTPTVFRNTELVYSDRIAEMVADMGFEGMLAEGADHVLRGRTPTRMYESGGVPGFPLLLKHYQLSDDIAFRFSQRTWSAWPLRAETYTHWLAEPFSGDDIINLFMDFETFGEHQWEETGIFHFFESVIAWLHDSGKGRFVTPSQVFQEQEPVDVFSAEEPVSWADVDRDLTAWLGNELQWDAIRVLYRLHNDVLRSGDPQLIEDWRRLQTSDHFYYMCTKWSNDGDVHAYFSPYGSPYDAYVNFNNVLADMKGRVALEQAPTKPLEYTQRPAYATINRTE